MSAGYSGTPLFRKLGLKSGMRASVVEPPTSYRDLLGPDAKEVSWQGDLRPPRDFVHLFTTERERLRADLPEAVAAVRPNGMIWVSWPKKAPRQPTDLTEDVIRAEALPLGLVDVKVCAVDAVWSGLKLVIRRENR